MGNIFDDIETPQGYRILSKLEMKQRLAKLVPRAFETLERNLFSFDPKVQVQAALGILDRSGFGPHSKVTVEESTEDLSNLSLADLRERAMKIAASISTEKQALSENEAFNDDDSTAVH